MDDKKYELYREVLARLEKAGVLNELILIGSWCIPCYRDYFGGKAVLTPIKTRDIDFLVPDPGKLRVNTDIPDLVKDLGFIVDFQGSKGYKRLVHPELFIEFLVNEKGRGIDKPVPLPQIGMNAQALRFMDILAGNTIRAAFEGIPITIPHPAVFCLHKLLISSRRATPDKMQKDRRDALLVLSMLKQRGDIELFRSIFASFHKNWKKIVLDALEAEKEDTSFIKK